VQGLKETATWYLKRKNISRRREDAKIKNNLKKKNVTENGIAKIIVDS